MPRSKPEISIVSRRDGSQLFAAFAATWLRARDAHLAQRCMNHTDLPNIASPWLRHD
jgi:hypothetical protein